MAFIFPLIIFQVFITNCFSSSILIQLRLSFQVGSPKAVTVVEINLPIESAPRSIHLNANMFNGFLEFVGQDTLPNITGTIIR